MTILRIAIVGCGRIGSALAFQLARSGNDVTVVARPGSERLEQLRKDGGIVDFKGERASVSIAAALDEETSFDVVIVTMVEHQLAAVMPALQRSAAARILLMFNTFDPEDLRDKIGARRAAFGMPFIQAQLDSAGRLQARIGVAGRRTLLGDQRLVELFNGAGVPAALETDMLHWLRSHAPLCVAFESASVAGVLRDGGASWRETLVIARGVRAAFALIKVLGYPLHRSKRKLARTPTWLIAAMLWSMSRIRSFRDLLATGKAEADALVDCMAGAAQGAPGFVRAADLAGMRPK